MLSKKLGEMLAGGRRIEDIGSKMSARKGPVNSRDFQHVRT